MSVHHEATRLDPAVMDNGKLIEAILDALVALDDVDDLATTNDTQIREHLTVALCMITEGHAGSEN